MFVKGCVRILARPTHEGPRNYKSTFTKLYLLDNSEIIQRSRRISLQKELEGYVLSHDSL